MTLATPLMTARGLCAQARGTDLLRGVDLSIAPGRITAVMGANGAGKSVLLRLLHGLMTPSAGHILWQGHPLDRAARRAQAMVFQHPVLLRRSVRANLDFALAAHGIARKDRKNRVDAALDRARLGHLAARPARVLSGGEQQRLALARAIATEPALLLLDEPTASLDPAATAIIEREVRAANASGMTVVLVTHDLHQARRLADDVAFLHAGTLAEAGPAATLLHTPQSPAAQAWIGGHLYLPEDPDPAQKISGA